jgi:hypothetical protein
MYRVFIAVLCGLLLVQCQKEIAVSEKELTAPVTDSIVGTWKYLYDYHTTVSQSNPDSVLDTYSSGARYTPYSYLKIGNDLSFTWYITEMQSLPTIGHGLMGKMVFIDSIRALKWMVEKETFNDFTSTISHDPPTTGPPFRIEYLSSDSMVLYFRTPVAGNKYSCWHDVYKR